MNKIAKRVITIVVASVILVGAYGGYQAVEGYMDSKISIERGKYEAISSEYEDYKADAKKRLEKISEEVEMLQGEKMELVRSIDAKTIEIRIVHKTITDLEQAARNLTDVGDKLYNANLQIQEYKKVVNMQEARFRACKMTIVTQEEIIKRCVSAAQEFEQLYLHEEQLKKMVENRLSLSEKRLIWEKTKFKGSAVVAIAAGGFLLYDRLKK